MKIAFFDSGIGGMTVLHEAIKQLPDESYIYYADSANIPYGTKSSEEIKDLVTEAVKFLNSHNLKALVLACNTATSVVVKKLRTQYPFPIIGMEPALKPALSLNSSKKILVCATQRTLQEDKLKLLIEQTYSGSRVELRSLQSLVTYAEAFQFTGADIESYLKKAFLDITPDTYAAVVLGCTHFLYYKPIISRLIGRDIQIIDGNEGTIKRLSSLIEPAPSTEQNPIQYYSSKAELTQDYFKKYLEFYDSIQSLQL